MKVSAVLFFKAIIGVYYAHDSINIDTDFRGKTIRYVREYLRRLFLNEFPGDSKRCSPSITFVSSRTDGNVFDAHVKSQLAKDIRKAPLEIQRRWEISKDPSITSEVTPLE